ncbi:hypothetical protein K402DRAFT_439219 [Aulographum hederae CBS 113979]|uniref:Uncharacterized protein n=1 Tax=Aulographum hederae CBS 113979 TaxID=1176131 RepID=A0A6G1GLN7_9PEZI|nr:hypothetical protein K402DRAFT_439219 [Aulographum hederae CBS 113979]
MPFSHFFKYTAKLEDDFKHLIPHIHLRNPLRKDYDMRQLSSTDTTNKNNKTTNETLSTTICQLRPEMPPHLTPSQTAHRANPSNRADHNKPLSAYETAALLKQWNAYVRHHPSRCARDDIVRLPDGRTEFREVACTMPQLEVWSFGGAWGRSRGRRGGDGDGSYGGDGDGDGDEDDDDDDDEEEIDPKDTSSNYVSSPEYIGVWVLVDRPSPDEDSSGNGMVAQGMGISSMPPPLPSRTLKRTYAVKSIQSTKPSILHSTAATLSLRSITASASSHPPNPNHPLHGEFTHLNVRYIWTAVPADATIVFRQYWSETDFATFRADWPREGSCVPPQLRGLFEGGRWIGDWKGRLGVRV